MKWMTRQRLRALFARRSIRIAIVMIAISWIGWRAFRLAVGSPRAELANATWSESTRVLARDGRLLGERRSTAGLLGRRISLSEVSPRLVLATIASEDRGFYRHDGIDRAAVARALASDVWHWRIVSGGSTITSQLVKRLDHRGAGHSRTFATKVVEMARAQNLEAELDKKAILEAYLNLIDYGHGFAGPDAAARGYFGVPASEVSLAQAALLAVLPRAPSALDPIRHLDRARKRQRALLHAMEGRGDISREDLARALDEEIVILPPKTTVLVAPHLVLEAPRDAGDVHSAIDFDLQHDTEAAVRTHVNRLRARNASSIAVVVIDNATGDVLASVGSADYFDTKSAGAVDLVRAKRQAGSTLKPFLYAHAFERGTSPMEPLADVPTDLGTTGAVYAPDNFDGVFNGPIPAREALAGSLNVPAVRLVAQMGARDAVSVLRHAGLELKGGAEKFGVSIALGSAEVSPRELADAYAMLARGGVLGSGERVFEEAAVALVADALGDPLARVRGLHARGPFALPFPVALKTGTSTGFRDAWTAGFTHERTVVVWVGNANGTATDQVTGAGGAGPIFYDVMRRAMADLPARGALFDAAVTEVAEVCALSGERPGAACPDRVERRFALGRAPVTACTMHRHARGMTCSEGAGAKTVVALPETYARFLGERADGAPGLDAHGFAWVLASRMSGCAGARARAEAGAGAGAGAEAGAEARAGARVVIVSPRNGAVFHADEAPVSADAFEVVAATEGMGNAAPLEVLVDGVTRATLLPPYKGLVPITRGEHSVEVRPRDPNTPGRVARAEILVR